MNTDIIGKALLVNLSISQFSPTRKDATATTEVLVAKSASRGSAEVRKQLLPKAATEPIAKLVREIRADHALNTLPWLSDGTRLLPTENWMTYTELMATHRNRFNSLVDEFVKQYESYRQTAMKQLGLLFDSRDYPDIANVYSKFGLRTIWSPLPKSDDFRLSLAEDELEELNQDLDKRVADAVVEANKDLYHRLGEHLKRVSERLSDPDNIFRDTMIEGLRDLCKLVPRLNITADPLLATLCQEAGVIGSKDPQQLRDDDALRAETKAKADEVLRKMGITIAPVDKGVEGDR